MTPSSKILPTALKRIRNSAPDSLLTVTIRTMTSLTNDEIRLLTEWGGTLVYDSGIMVILTVPARHINAIVAWECVLELK